MPERVMRLCSGVRACDPSRAHGRIEFSSAVFDCDGLLLPRRDARRGCCPNYRASPSPMRLRARLLRTTVIFGALSLACSSPPCAPAASSHERTGASAPPSARVVDVQMSQESVMYVRVKVVFDNPSATTCRFDPRSCQQSRFET